MEGKRDGGSTPHPTRPDSAPRATELGASEPTDADLLRAHTAGDRYAFETLLTRHRDRLWAVALRTMRDPDDAADALQDAMISAFRSAGSFRAESAVTTWLHRIVVNACLDRIRRRKARPTVSLPEEGRAELRTTRDEYDESVTSMAVRTALAQLAGDQRAAIVLVDIEGYSVAESAQVLGVAEGTVKSRCARGRAKLATVLAPLRNPAEGSDVQSSSGAFGEGP